MGRETRWETNEIRYVSQIHAVDIMYFKQITFNFDTMYLEIHVSGRSWMHQNLVRFVIQQTRAYLSN